MQPKPPNDLTNRFIQARQACNTQPQIDLIQRRHECKHSPSPSHRRIDRRSLRRRLPSFGSDPRPPPVRPPHSMKVWTKPAPFRFLFAGGRDLLAFGYGCFAFLGTSATSPLRSCLPHGVSTFLQESIRRLILPCSIANLR